mgnify:FL=1|tara:strand:- start:368 stop:805 length:438 start_codon:yes stop_codon:yes gene_type:complete
MAKVKLYKLDSNVARIIATVSRLTEIPISKIRGKTRHSEVVTARRICMVLINDKLRYSSTVNASIFHRDHATVLHAFKVHADLMDVDKPYQEFYNICATAVGIQGMADSNDKDDMIAKFAARVEHLEYENQELKEQINKVSEILS